MSSSSDSWGGDYSLLLQSIEGQISQNILNQSPAPTRLSMSDASAAKRRWDATSPTDLPMSSAKKLRSYAELDELQIQNEQLREKVARLESERQIAKDEHIRQLKFLDERCASLKKESSERLEKYYEEKKKWQGKHRELEMQLKKATEKANSAAPVGTPSQQPARNSSGHEEITQRLKALEQELTVKMTEARDNLKARLNAESKVQELEISLRALQSSAGNHNHNLSAIEEARQEARQLRQQYGELESIHKRTAREHEAMKTKLKNQTLLEEELSSLKARLRLTEEKLNTYKQSQIEHQQLVEEKSLWTQLFQDIVSKPEHQEVLLLDEAASARSSGGGSAPGAGTAVSPTAVLQLLSAYQSRCALLFQAQGQLQHTLSELRRQAREAHTQHEVTLTELQSTQARLDTVEQQLRAALQQGRLYDGELRSLRSLLATYDVEFQIGKPEAVKVMALKDRQIEELRGELDTVRQSALALGAQVRTLEANAEQQATALAAAQVEVAKLSAAVAAAEALAAEAQAQAAAATATMTAASADGMESVSTVEVGANDAQNDAEQLDKLRAQVQESQRDVEYLQYITGLDYFPDRTKVLHLVVNPTTGAPAVSTLPTVTELRRQRGAFQQQLRSAAHAYTQLQESSASAVAAASATAAGAVNDSSSSSESVAPAAAQVPQVPDSNVMNQRLKEQFKERIASFREGVYLLMGYKVDLYTADGSPNSLPRLRLRSMFAERPEDNLMFQMRGENAELLDTDFASRLDPTLLRYLTQYNSVPAFVSAVTLSLFENQTFQG